jgi:hypothetical protein
MRALLLGTDFMYNQDGNLVPLEINTGLGFDGFERVEQDMNDIFDFSGIQKIITENQITKIHYIGILSNFYQFLTSSTTVSCEIHRVAPGSITIPYIEDNEQTLIIRSAYDTTAIVDDTYCANKINFMKLISGSSIGSEFAYIDEANNLINGITTILDNGVHPNFILKSSVPSYDKNVYPKLFKVSNIVELETILTTLTSGYFLMPFYINTNKLIDSHVSVIRSFNLLLPPDLTSISVGAYHKICENGLVNTPTYNTTTFELSYSDRITYLTNIDRIFEPKLVDTDLVEMVDGSFRTVVELQVGDLLKTIDIPNPFNVKNDNERTNYKIDYNTLKNGTTYSTNRIINKTRVHRKTEIVTITFDDNTTWFDNSSAFYLTERNNEIRFIGTVQLEVGDKLLLIDTSSETLTFIEKVVVSKSMVTTYFEGWTISVENAHLFLTKNPENKSSYVSIEHNSPGCYRCNDFACAETYWYCFQCYKGYGCCQNNGSCWSYCTHCN